MSERAGHHRSEPSGRRVGGTALDEVVLETRCGHCLNLIFAEVVDPFADVSIFEAGDEPVCGDCADSGRPAGA